MAARKVCYVAISLVKKMFLNTDLHSAASNIAKPAVAMGRSSPFTQQQKNWLTARLPEFTTAQDKKILHQF
jgi:hypothetical protein